MSDVRLLAKKAEHMLSVMLTDANGHQHELNAKLQINYRREKFAVAVEPIPSEVLAAGEFNGALKNLLEKGKQAGREILSEFKKARSGGQMNLFDDYADADTDEEEDEDRVPQAG